MIALQSKIGPPIAELFLNGNFLKKEILFLFIAQILAIVIAIIVDQIVILPLVILGIWYLYVSFNNQHLWIFSIFMLYIPAELRTSGVISIWDIANVVYAWGILLLWAFTKWFNGKPILKSFGDRLWFLFFVLCCSSVIQNIVQGEDIVKWFRELLFFVPYFLFLPFRESLEKNRKTTLIAMGVGFLSLSVFIGIDNLFHYKQAASIAVYAWELLAGRQATTEPLFVTGLLFAVSSYLYMCEIKLKVMFLLLAAFYSTVLILTFSRGYWFGAAVGIIVLLILLERKPRKELIFTIIGIVSVVVIIFLTAFGNYGTTVLDVVGNRVGGQSLNVIQDPSLHARYNETRSVIQYISMNPIIGYGLGSSFRFLNPIQGAMQEVNYVHNGYLFLWLKLGIVGLSLFLLTYMYYLWDAVKIIYKHRNSFDYFLHCTIISLLIAMLAISITSPQFISRDSILIIATCWALIGASKYDSEKEQSPI